MKKENIRLVARDFMKIEQILDTKVNRFCLLFRSIILKFRSMTNRSHQEN